MLAWLSKVGGRLDVRIAIPVDQDGMPIVGGDMAPYFHEKIGGSCVTRLAAASPSRGR